MAGRQRGEATRRARAWTALGAALALAAGVSGALAQTVDCGRLQAAIRASESDSGQRDDSAFARAADQQRREIDRTRRYAAQVGCSQGQAGFFGSNVPPECEDIEDRLARMQDNLDRMQDRVTQAGNDDNAARQAAMIARYNATCVGNPSVLPQGGDAGYLPNDGRNPADLSTVPVDPDDLSTVPLNGDIMQDGSPGSRNAGRTICVRSCDGGYFPLAPRASTDQLDQLDTLCKASCPNTEAHLYTMRGSDGLTSATAIDGSSYTALPAAFKFEKSYTAACTCKPPGQSWAQALDGAEKLLTTGDRHDVTVTAAMSEQMAKPVAPTPTPPKGKAAKAAAAAAAAASVPVAADKRVAAEGLRASQAPTASNDSAGIGGQVTGERVLGRSDGLRITVDGPDGVRKRIRLIVP